MTEVAVKAIGTTITDEIGDRGRIPSSIQTKGRIILPATKPSGTDTIRKRMLSTNRQFIGPRITRPEL